MNPLSLIPTGWLLPVGAAAIVALLLTTGVQTKRVEWAKAETLEVRNAWALDRANAQAAAAKQAADFRAEEHRRAAAQQEIIDATEKQLVKARADVAIADAAAGRLQQRVAALVAAARQAAQDPGPAGSSPPASDAAGMLADVLGRCIAHVRLLATVADERGTAGAACERTYDSLTTTEDKPE